ncbi:MAG: Growth inhibitor PemK [Hyphomicrobiales bacterium]|nr:Growth inhibitor PemK [Hyphomicrobiales bacterium]
MEGIRRGAFVAAAFSGDYGKPRPALVVQTDLMAEAPSIVLAPLTSELRDDVELFRVDVSPSEAIDKIAPLDRRRIGALIGYADDVTMLRVDRALRLVLGLT